MILSNSVRALVAAALFGMGVPAHADVMEVGDNGARWVAGGAPSLSRADATQEVVTLGPDLQLPADAASDPAFHARFVPGEYSAKVAELSHRFDLSPSLIEALVWQESRWRANAVSPVGARGLAQLMPGTARELGVDPHDPFQNLEGGARYLRQQLDRFDGDLEKALAAYNAGPGRVIRAGGVPRIRETQNYVVAIMGRLSNHSRTSN